MEESQQMDRTEIDTMETLPYEVATVVEAAVEDPPELEERPLKRLKRDRTVPPVPVFTPPNPDDHDPESKEEHPKQKESKPGAPLPEQKIPVP